MENKAARARDWSKVDFYGAFTCSQTTHVGSMIDEDHDSDNSPGGWRKEAARRGEARARDVLLQRKRQHACGGGQEHEVCAHQRHHAEAVRLPSQQH